MVSLALRHAGRRCGLTSTTRRALLPARFGTQHERGVSSSLWRSMSSSTWRPVSVLDEWVAREARPISLRQLMVFGRSLTESRLLSSANYVRTELPTRIAHRIRDMQQLPYVVVTNPHIKEVYELYNNAFEMFRKVKEVKNLEDNEKFCQIISGMLKAHLTVIPKLSMGILESRGCMDAKDLDKFMNTVLRSRISRRVIAEQHLALTETYHSPWFSPGAKLSESEFIGEVFIKCIAKDVIERCTRAVESLARSTYGQDVELPEIKVEGHLEASFPYILSHLEYIIGELLRNSVQAVVERRQRDKNKNAKLPPIEVTICEAQQHVIIRISDQGGGIPREELPYLWSFSKGPQSQRRLENLGRVPKLAATMQELHVSEELGRADMKTPSHSGSLSSMTSRPPNLRLGMGLPLSRVYAEYWAGSLELHSLEGYGVDAFLQISKLGNRNEQLTTRATMDAV
ncbi:[Pyruvate dehydrogenase (acetyl-transferring)] kinase 2, mitochondrial [Colletotrichum tanaceti]|uniref:Protein-serine/threonine kinase n=1 Tax=Colletotrichum tanaceti TaxID=1306861 RepID=A0A4U6XNM4_9PEZI|nr:[Pyruvate dehydrogenase (acetyl-transferring)] kinase 2, mitochondrial [Colletotrichum tanaceti]TKW57338.1 [Pyruvate dehydrogenase (acetyl-transferring)] kinase 2, mitochondrial [Colletotrichum tanaceti]